MTLPPALDLALAFLRGGRRARLLPAALVALAAAGLVVVLAVARGFDESFTGKLLLATGHVRVRPAEGPGFPDHREAVAAFRAAGHRAAARFAGECVLESEGFSAGVRATGVAFADEADVSRHLSRYRDITLNDNGGGAPPPAHPDSRSAGASPPPPPQGSPTPGPGHASMENGGPGPSAPAGGGGAEPPTGLQFTNFENKTFSTLPPIVVGAALARAADLSPGDAVRLRGTGDPVPFRVAGTFAIGLADYDYSFVYLPLAEAAALFDYPELATELVLSLDDPDAAEAVARGIERDFPGTRAASWQEANAALVSTLAVERFALRLLVALVGALALSGVAFLLLVSIDERRRAIGVLAAFGMSSGEIRRAFLAEGFLLASAGLAAGLAAGVAAVGLLARVPIPLPAGFAQTYAAERLPVKLAASDLGYVAAAFLILAALVAHLATLRLARIPVRDLMR